MNPREIPQDFEDFAKVAKFRQIWSHRRGVWNGPFPAYLQWFTVLYTAGVRQLFRR